MPAEKDNLTDEIRTVQDELEQGQANVKKLETQLTQEKEEFKSTLQHLNDELATCKETLHRKRQAAHLLEAGYALYRKENHPEAYDLFEEASALDKDTLLPYILKASDHYHQGRYEQCLEACKVAMSTARIHDADKRARAFLYELAADASVKLADVRETDAQRHKVRPEQTAHIEEAVQSYGKSQVNCPNEAVDRKHKQYAKLLQQIHTNPELSQNLQEQGKEFFVNGELQLKPAHFVLGASGDYKQAMQKYNEAVKSDAGQGWILILNSDSENSEF